MLAWSVLTGCSGDGQGASRRAQTLVYCSEGDPATFNPQLATSSLSLDATSGLVFETLLRSSQQAPDPTPWLAESWERSPDHLHYVFHLRRGVRFHAVDGFHPTRDMQAADVVFSFRRQLRKGHPFHHVAHGDYAYFRANRLHQAIMDVVEIDPYTVEFMLRESVPNLPQLLSMDFAAIQSSEYADFRATQPELFDARPVGTGPFRLTDYRPGQFIRYKAFDNYWGRPAGIPQLVFAISPSPALRYARMITGECDLMSEPQPGQVRLLKQESDLIIDSQPGMNVAYWAFNTNKPRFANAQTRQALSMAINREKILQVVFSGSAILADSPLPAGMAGHVATRPIPFNQIQARKMLEKSGWDFSRPVDIWAMPVQRPYNPDARKMAELIQYDLAQIGVRSRVRTYAWATFLDKLRRGEHDTVLLGWRADTPDPVDFLRPILSCAARANGTNRAFWCDEDFDRWLQQARVSDDPQDALLRAQERFREQLPWLPIAYARQFLVYRKDLSNVRRTPSGRILFANIRRNPETRP
jgi:dipeptide transport system substrate-binding protein